MPIIGIALIGMGLLGPLAGVQWRHGQWMASAAWFRQRRRGGAELVRPAGGRHARRRWAERPVAGGDHGHHAAGRGPPGRCARAPRAAAGCHGPATARGGTLARSVLSWISLAASKTLL